MVITCNYQKKLSVRVILSLRGEIKLNSFDLMGVRIDPLTMDETVQAVEKFVLEQRPLHLMGVNADKINQCQTDESIKKIVNDSEIINADGASVFFGFPFFGLSSS